MDFGNLRIPEWMKLIMIFIDRIGFPILAFVCMVAMFYLSQTKLIGAVEENTKALLKFSTTTNSFQSQVCKEHQVMMSAIEKNGDRITQLYLHTQGVKF
ncbi:MAG: hypothetical protein WC444_07170 [Candidatus Paceibacterota bacterium]